MKILFAGSEAIPFISTGGLGDVLGSLPQAIAKDEGMDVRVVLPLYKSIKEKFGSQLKFVGQTTVKLSWRNQYCGLFSIENGGVTYYFIDNEYYFGDPYLYKWNDLERFAFFDKACLEILTELDFKPQIIHAHDWQTGMIPVLLNAYYINNEF